MWENLLTGKPLFVYTSHLTLSWSNQVKELHNLLLITWFAPLFLLENITDRDNSCHSSTESSTELCVWGGVLPVKRALPFHSHLRLAYKEGLLQSLQFDLTSCSSFHKYVFTSCHQELSFKAFDYWIVYYWLEGFIGLESVMWLFRTFIVKFNFINKLNWTEQDKGEW